MKIRDLFDRKPFVFSYELFPPKPDSPIGKLYATLEAIRGLKPDYISITYNAGGAGGNRTLELASVIKNTYGIEPLAHLTAIQSTEASVDAFLAECKKSNIQNVLALRGDRNPSIVPQNVFRYASDLAAYIKANSDLNIVGAGYPEGHFEAPDLQTDIENLRKKIDAGVTHINTQLFFDNEDFLRFRDLCRAKGIDVPVQAGIMPIVKKAQIERTVVLTGAKVPAPLAKIFQRFGDDPMALMDAGIAYATQQIVALRAEGVDGVHLYIMNNDFVARRIYENIGSLI